METANHSQFICISTLEAPLIYVAVCKAAFEMASGDLTLYMRFVVHL